MKRRSFLKTFAGLVPGVAVAGGIGYPSHPSFDDTAALPKGMVGEDFLILARQLAREKRTVVGLFHDAAFAGREIPPSLRPEDLQKAWGARDDIRVVLLDKD